MKVLLIILPLLIPIAACGKPRAKEKSCHFLMSDHGYRISWGQRLPIRMHVHESVPAEFIPSIRRAMSTWNVMSGRYLFDLTLPKSFGPNMPFGDGNNTIHYLTTSYDKPGEEARASVSFIGSVMVEADIRYNAKNFKLSTDQTPGTVDFESLTVHELGHILGLDHINGKGGVMELYLPLELVRRAPTAYEIEELACEY